LGWMVLLEHGRIGIFRVIGRFQFYHVQGVPSNPSWDIQLKGKVAILNRALSEGVPATQDYLEEHNRTFIPFDFMSYFDPGDLTKVHLTLRGVDNIIHNIRKRTDLNF